MAQALFRVREISFHLTIITVSPGQTEPHKRNIVLPKTQYQSIFLNWTSGQTAPAACRLNGENHKVSGLWGCTGPQPQQSQTGDPTCSCTRQQESPLHCPQPAAAGLKLPHAYTSQTASRGFKVPVPSVPAPPKDTCRYHMLSPSCQTEAYSQIQCAHRPIFFSTHHRHSPEDSISSLEILPGVGKDLLTL